MERRFSRDFDDVRIHTGGDAEVAADSVSARAYTVGTNIVFGRGMYAPDGTEGRKTVAHELAHVIQQSRGGARPSLSPDSTIERSAADAANAAAHGTEQVDVGGASDRGVARQVDIYAGERKKIGASLGLPQSEAKAPAVVWAGQRPTWLSPEVEQQAVIDLEKGFTGLKTYKPKPSPAPVTSGKPPSAQDARHQVNRSLMAGGLKPLPDPEKKDTPFEAKIKGDRSYQPLTDPNTGDVAEYLQETDEARIYFDREGHRRVVPKAKEVDWWKVAKGFATEGAEQGLELMGTLYAPGVNVSDPLNPFGQIEKTAKMVESLRTVYKQYGGGWEGAAMVAEQFNPAYQTGIAAIETQSAYEHGESEETGKLAFRALKGVVDTVMLARGAASGLKGLAKPKVGEPAPTLPKVAEPTPPKVAEPTPPKVAEPTPPKVAEPAPAEPTPPKVAEPAPAEPTPPAPKGAGAARKRNQAAMDKYMGQELRRVSDPKHTLHFLVEQKVDKQGNPVLNRAGKPTYDWRKTPRTTKKGVQQRGRYEGNEAGPTVQAGHQAAHASGATEQLMIEDADLNQLTGQVIESKGAFSFKTAVEIGGVRVDEASALQWERLGLIPEGTVAKLPRILPPEP